MKAKHIITTCGVILGGLAVAQGASAVVTYQGSSDVQFTFNPVLSLTLSGGNFVISDLAPGTKALSNAVTASVASNSSAGYILKASVGNGTYSSTDLTSSDSRFAMISSGTSLAKGTWGYTLNDGTSYGALALYNASDSTTLATSSDPSGSVVMKIGAYAKDDQLPGTYNNVVNFSVVSQVAAHTVSLMPGANVASVALGGGGTSRSYNEGDTVTISATCSSGKTFSNWGKSFDFGVIANESAASTSYTVGNGDVTLTAYCK
ncbi:hypothetical protein IKG24_00835 [Candidatus Saccharibacteria bacterium]|nr:hypothetical protein [Candidatus Saccharibacteria bacterium]